MFLMLYRKHLFKGSISIYFLNRKLITARNKYLSIFKKMNWCKSWFVSREINVMIWAEVNMALWTRHFSVFLNSDSDLKS